MSTFSTLDPCQDYILDDDSEIWKRSTGNILATGAPESDKLCDRLGWKEGWRRFVSGAGTMMATECPPARACGMYPYKYYIFLFSIY